jgi:hypothetical protein
MLIKKSRKSGFLSKKVQKRGKKAKNGDEK